MNVLRRSWTPLAIIVTLGPMGCQSANHSQSTPQSIGDRHHRQSFAEQPLFEAADDPRSIMGRNDPLIDESTPTLSNNDAVPVRPVQFVDRDPDTHPSNHFGRFEPATMPPVATMPIVEEAFYETDIRDALTSLCEQASFDLVMGEDVQGTTSALIKHIPVDRAMRQILLPLGYTHRIDDGHCYVGSPDPESTMFPHLSSEWIYRSNFRDAESLVDALPERHRAYVRIDGRGGRIVIEAPHEIGQQIESRLRRSDQPISQVVLEVLVCVYNPETNVRFGFDFRQGVTVSDRSGAALSFDSLGIGANYGGAGIQSQLNNFKVARAFLRALEQKGHLSIRAAPHVMAEDGQKAEIQIGRETYFSAQPTMAGGGFGFRQDIQKIQSGILLELTPTIRAPQITIDIDRVEVSEDLSTSETQMSSQAAFPVVNRRRVNTTVHVNDGNTIVIGGLQQQQTFDQVNKVPVLGDTPAIGKLFRRTERNHRTTELAIFISPKIVAESWDHIVPEPLDVTCNARRGHDLILGQVDAATNAKPIDETDAQTGSLATLLTSPESP